MEEPDDRTYGQRMHDALEQVCDRLLRTDTAVPDAGGTPATVIITLDLADLLDKTGYAVAVRRDADTDREGAAARRTPPRCTSPRSPRKVRCCSSAGPGGSPPGARPSP